MENRWVGWIRKETEKGTTQYICPNCHDYHEFREDFGEHTFSENYIFCRRCGRRNGTGTPPPLTPPNEPLTLEQLREMDGEPVYIPEINCWVLITKNPFVPLFTWPDGEQCSAYDWYEQIGSAYRRPPEGEKDQND